MGPWAHSADVRCRLHPLPPPPPGYHAVTAQPTSDPRPLRMSEFLVTQYHPGPLQPSPLPLRPFVLPRAPSSLIETPVPHTSAHTAGGAGQPSVSHTHRWCCKHGCDAGGAALHPAGLVGLLGVRGGCSPEREGCWSHRTKTTIASPLRAVCVCTSPCVRLLLRRPCGAGTQADRAHFRATATGAVLCSIPANTVELLCVACMRALTWCSVCVRRPRTRACAPLPTLYLAPCTQCMRGLLCVHLACRTMRPGSLTVRGACDKRAGKDFCKCRGSGG